VNFYWLYDLPNFLLCALIIAFFIVIGLGGLFATRRWVRRLHSADHSHNDIVGFYLAAITVLYGITVGLVAVGTWETYSDVQNRVEREAAALGALYRDVGAFPEPIRSQMQADLRTYARQVIDVGWPMQRKGIVPNNASPVLSDFQASFMSFEPATERQKIVSAEAYRAFNELTESRRARLNSINAELPGPVWAVVIAGAVLSIVTTWFFDTTSAGMHTYLTVLLSILLGLIVFMIVALDNPYRGRISVTGEPLERVYQQIMVPPPTK
jgi:Protein of unknown function (DUF4239)